MSAGPAAAVERARARKVEVLISRLLRGGVVISLVLVVAGTGLSFAHHPSYWSDPSALGHLTNSSASFPHTPGQVLAGLAEHRGQAVVALGLMVLIATPVARVAISIVSFAYQRDRTFVAITSMVLALLLLSFALGKGAG